MNGEASEHMLLGMLALVQRGVVPMLVLGMCDGDGLKIINDIEGHIPGNEAIRQISYRLATAFRIYDITCCLHGTLVGRFGGDEFVLGLPIVREADIQALENRLVSAQASDWDCNGFSYPLHLSVGLRVIRQSDLPSDRDPVTIDDLERFLDQADQAQIVAKCRGKGKSDRRLGIVCYNSEVEADYIAIRNERRRAELLRRAQRDDL